GAGDEATANVTVSGFLSDFRTDGSEFNYFDAGGVNHYGYGIVTPIAGGTPSQEWGAGANNSVLYDYDTRTISVDYTGLTDSDTYLLVLTYLSNDSGGTKQNITDANGNIIQQQITLPAGNARTYAVMIPKTAVVSGNLQLNFNALSGPRALIAGIHIVKQPAIDSSAPSIQITQPLAGALLPDAVHTIAGTATDSQSPIASVAVGIQYEGGTTSWRPATSFMSSGNWTYRWDHPVSGNYQLYATAIDPAGNEQSLLMPVPVSVDTVAPGAVNALTAQGNNGRISLFWTLSADDGAGANDVDHYTIHRSISFGSGFNEIAQVAAGSSQYDDATITQGTDYYYYVSSVDQAGNSTDSATSNVANDTGVVDTTAPEDVNGLSATATQSNGSNSSVYLAWSPAANSEGDLVAHKIYISVDGGTNYGSNAPSYDDGLAVRLGATARNYQVSGLTIGPTYTFKVTTLDEIPNESAGAVASVTPTGATTEVAGLPATIAEDTSLENGVFRVTAQTTIPAGVTLRLSAGTILKFNAGNRLYVYGTLLAEGANGNPVVFTAYTDDEYGGDTNGDGPSSGTPGYWNYIQFYSGSGASRLDNAVVRYSGGDTASLYIRDGSNIEVRDSEIRDGAGRGIYAYSASPYLVGNLITNHSSQGVEIYNSWGTVFRNNRITNNSGNGIYVPYGSMSQLDGNTIAGNGGYGLYYSSVASIASVTNNTITGNNAAVRIAASEMPDESNVLVPNTQRRIVLLGNTLQTDTRFRVLAKGTVDELRNYLVVDNDLTVPTNIILTVDPAVIVKFSSSRRMIVNGGLVADGTSNEKIVFTAYTDDSEGGDSNGDGNQTSPINGYWGGIQFNNSVLEPVSVLNHTRVRYAGAAASAALYFNNADIRVENSEVSNSSTNGIRIYNASPTVTGTRIWGNSADGVRIEQPASNPSLTFNRISSNLSDGIELLTNANATATNNQIFLNRSFGLRNGTGNTIDASQTWWGDTDATGPYNAGTNAAGTGAEISDNVTFSPFQTTVGTDYSYVNYSASAGSSAGNIAEPVLVQGTLSDEWDTGGLSPDRTMVSDPDAVIIDYTGLDPSKRYQLRADYYNGDPATVFQSLTDGTDNGIHASMTMPTVPTQYEFVIPQAYYSGGDLTLKFVHDNPSTSFRAALPEIRLMEYVEEFTPPRFEQVAFNDLDGDGVISLGDELHFQFSEPMDASLLVTGTTDANTKLATDGGQIYGTVNQLRWSGDGTTAIVTITAGFTVAGSEAVTPVGLTDQFGNAAVGTQLLSLIDTVAPQFTGITWNDVDASNNLSLGDTYIFSFDSVMDTNVIQGGIDANSHLRPAGGARYGTTNTVTWAADSRSVTVGVTDGYNILGDEQVVPSVFVTDLSGNSVTGVQTLTGRDLTAPSLTGVRFDDADGSGDVSVGDWFIFAFSEPMLATALSDNSNEANTNMSPGGASYGTVNRIRWNAGNTEVSIGVTTGFTLVGNEVVDPSNQLTDTANNPVANTIALNLVDDVPPTVVNASGNTASPVPVTNDYRVIVQFSNSMNTAVEPLVTITGSGSTLPTVAGGGAWSGTVLPNDTYTTPSIVLTQAMDAAMEVNVSAGSDLYSNVMVPENSLYSFVIQAGPPTISNYPLAPAVSNVATGSIVLNGDRTPNTSIWMGGSEIAALGSGAWSASIVLSQGLNDLVIFAKDVNQNPSASVTVRIYVDSVAPVIGASVPVSGSYINTVPNSLDIGFIETGSGLDLNASSLTVNKGGSPLSGNWTINGTTLSFTPDIQFLEDSYQASIQLVDNAGLQSGIANITFIIDQTPPQTPVIDPLPATTSVNQQVLSGTKEANAAILVDGVQVVGNSAATTWSYTASLNQGLNSFAIRARDRAGNTSVAGSVSITYDNSAPGPVIPTANGIGDGTQAALDWSNYNEVANGNDIQFYTIYISGADFTDAGTATAIATVPAGNKSYVASGLIRGQQYYFAVVATDTFGNANLTVTTVSVATADTQAPEEVTNLNVNAAADSLIIQWTASADSKGDLAGYRVYFNGGSATDVSLATSYTINTLTAATAYPIRVTTYDNEDNESTGVSITGVTLLPNPIGLSANPLSSRVELFWTPVAPAQYVGQYAIYAATSDFTDVTAMTPSLVVGNSVVTTQLAGLTNGTIYYFAVTTINTSQGESKAVSTVPATPESDLDGPTLSNVTYNASPLNNGDTITRAGSIAVSVDDESGISRVLFDVDGTRLAMDTNGADGYSANWNIVDFIDGAHTLTISAFDTLENRTDLSLSLSVALAAPGAPVITAPSDGEATNQPTITVSGTAESQTEAWVYINASQTGTPISVGSSGQFSTNITLTPGSNAITVAAQNRGGLGPQSAPVTVDYDTSVPDAPTGLTALSKENGQIALSWTLSSDPRVVSYALYRSGISFADITQATPVNSAPLMINRFDDLPSADGDYYYRVVAVNDVDTPSLPSNEVIGTADSVAPRATEIAYTPSGVFDVATGRMAPGRVDVSVTVSEPLLTTPFLSITPSGGVPMSVSLSRQTDTAYTGWFDITDATITGTAYAVFSSRDQVGNRGSLVDVGASVEIDSDGPAITVLTVAPSAPIKNDQLDPVTVSVTLDLDDATPAGQNPQLSYLLSAAGRLQTDIANLVQLSAQSWRGSFQLPADAGLTEVENLQFQFIAVDDLGNLSNAIRVSNSFQVYQGDLPPLAAPNNLTAVALPGGVVRLEWQAVEGAPEYQIYRQAPAEPGLTEYARVTATSYDDVTGLEGDITYTVASVRQENGQESVSAQSNTVTVTADATVPDAPLNFALQLVGAGIQATWDAPVSATLDLTYNVYRSNGTTLVSVNGLTPIQTGIVPNSQGQLGYIDNSPDKNAPAYVATAVDAAGNESQPSNDGYLNVDLYPVATLKVVQQDTAAPVISWSHTGTNIDGYNLFLGANQETQLNAALLTATSYTDTAYTNNTRIYTVTAIDSNAVESVGRSVTLPQLTAALSADSSLNRGIMNRLVFDIGNTGPDSVDTIRLRVDVGGHLHASQSFSLAAGETRTVPMIVGGFADLVDPSPMITTLEVRPQTGEQIDIVRNQTIAVNEDALLLRVETQELTRNTAGQVRFTLTNTSDVEIEIQTARNNAQAASNEIRFLLRDVDGNVLSTEAFMQPLNNVITLTNGRTVARIAAGEAFTSDWFGLPIPESAPDAVSVELEIDRLHYHLGQSDAVSIAGMNSSQAAILSDTAYTATVTGVAPQASFGGEPITITGQALDRITGSPVGIVPVRIVVVVNGFERVADVVTDANGDYSYVFNPLAGESGIFDVSAIHPDILARPAQGRFTISRVTLSPAQLILNLPKNVQQAFDVVKATAGEGTTATNLRLAIDATDQPSSELPPGVTVTLGAPINLASQQSAKLPFTIVGNNTAAETGTLYLRLLSDESGAAVLGLVQIDYRLSEARPYLSFKPNFVETGVVYDSAVQESITLENTGLAAMTGVTVELLDMNDNPPPSWMKLLSQADQGDLAVGDKREIQIAASPANTVIEDNYQFKLRVSSANNPTVDINIFVVVTQSGIGGVLFKTSDIYTATLDANGVPVPGLAGARVRYQHEINLANEGELTTDPSGEAFFQNLPAGRYRFRASASNHEDLSGRFTIKPGVTGTEDIFLNYNLITIEWSVTEITIEDKYQITLQATFETDVPAAVVVMQPSSVALPDMQVGDVFNGELRVTNYGLVRADNLTFQLPESDAYYKYEFQQGLPDFLDAKGSLVIPYRITALAPFNPDGTGTGGGCGAYSNGGNVQYDYTCANGTTTGGSSGTSWFGPASGSSCGGTGGSPWYSNTGSRGDSGGRGGSSGGPDYSSMSGTSCPTPCPDGRCCAGGGSGGNGAGGGSGPSGPDF
ncbi:MAG TPA: hypothetical protein ENI68_02095, partial [Gammaproteobacteria bacterium]|nr:hypothetical protein [Gammaproteobacteria bacterium]